MSEPLTDEQIAQIRQIIRDELRTLGIEGNPIKALGWQIAEKVKRERAAAQALQSPETDASADPTT